MKRSISVVLAGMLCIQWVLFSCNKEKIVSDQVAAVVKPNPDTCVNVSSKGRIIGFNPFMSFLNFDTARFVKYDNTLGPGYVIEIENGVTKDTVITYRITTTNNFLLKPSHDNIGSLYLFKREFQDSLKIKFNYKLVNEKTEVFILTNTMTNVASIWVNFIKIKEEVILSCVSLNK